MHASTIGGINLLPESEKRAIYSRMVPKELTERFQLPPLDSSAGEMHARFKFAPGSSDMEMYIFHQPDFQDPVMYGHLTDTLASQIHILLYTLNDPASPRFDVDRMPDGSSTRFGTLSRNLAAEEAAMGAGLAPGQVRSGLRLLGPAISTFEQFVSELGHDIYFAEPLYYHNAIIFERYGFNYQSGRRLMERIETGFGAGGEFHDLLNSSTPFRKSDAAGSIRRRSWAIHDGIMGAPFSNVTMYKRVGKIAGVSSCPTCNW